MRTSSSFVAFNALDITCQGIGIWFRLGFVSKRDLKWQEVNQESLWVGTDCYTCYFKGTLGSKVRDNMWFWWHTWYINRSIWIIVLQVVILSETKNPPVHVKNVKPPHFWGSWEIALPTPPLVNATVLVWVICLGNHRSLTLHVPIGKWTQKGPNHKENIFS